MLEGLFAQLTVFLILRRLDQMLRLDKIMVLREGKLLEFGSAVELPGDPNSAFYEFLETTLLAYLSSARSCRPIKLGGMRLFSFSFR